MSAQLSQAYPRAARLKWARQPKNEAAEAAKCQVCAIYGRFAPSLSILGMELPQTGDQKAVTTHLGASTMVIWRPSMSGSDSTLAIGAVSTFTRCKSL